MQVSLEQQRSSLLETVGPYQTCLQRDSRISPAQRTAAFQFRAGGETGSREEKQTCGMLFCCFLVIFS